MPMRPFETGTDDAMALAMGSFVVGVLERNYEAALDAHLGAGVHDRGHHINGFMYDAAQRIVAILHEILDRRGGANRTIRIAGSYLRTGNLA